jgi:hypothetical protein
VDGRIDRLNLPSTDLLTFPHRADSLLLRVGSAMIFVPLGLAHILHANALPYYLFASAPKRVRNVAKILFRRLPRKVEADDISVVSDLSANASFYEYDHWKRDDSILVKTTECSGVECDNDTFVSCNTGVQDDWHSAVSQISSLREDQMDIDPMKMWLPTCPSFDSKEFTVALEVVPTYSPLQRIALSLARGLHHYNDEMSSLDQCFLAIPMIEGYQDDDVDSPHELYNKKSWLYRICKLRYRITMPIFRLNKSEYE